MPIFDQGYQHWHGPLSAHAWRWLTIARQGVRVQLKGRSLRTLLYTAWLPALALVAFMALWGLVEKKSATIMAVAQALLPADLLADPRAYRSTVWALSFGYFFKTEMFFIMLLVVVAGPGLISHDLRLNALPLYFARPLNRLDYFLGKLGVIGALVASVAVGPAVLAYAVGVCFSLDLGVIKDTWTVLVASVVYGLIVTASAGTLMLALSSLTRRSLYVGIAWAGLWIISGAVAAALTETRRVTQTQDFYEEEMARWVKANPPPAGVAVPDVRFGPRPRPPRGPKARFGLLDPFAAKGRGKDPWTDAWWKASQEARVKAQESQAEEQRKDWRPLFSYVGNLERLADQLLDSDAAWVTVGKAAVKAQKAAGGAMGGAGPPGFAERTDDRFLADQMVRQHPWQWSAGVLAGLLGLSTWTMTRRVRSLDRLR
jgi:hypothetical protein